ncbi:MAG: hypothetical protein ABIR39_14770 [Nocardioides sp.]|uniref:hypothetical protein n=1 Tax=Nocardioides sp. TaxID=35761 RepID=UPI0032644799
MTHTDDLLEPHEAELRDLLERTMTGTTAPVELGAHALQHGRRLRTRRRVGLASCAVAASAAAALILPMALGGGSTTVTDPAGEPSSSASEPPQESPPAEVPEGWWSMPSVDMVSTAEAILPDGVTVTSPGSLTADTEQGGPGTGSINAIVSGPAGPGRLNVMLFPTIAGATAGTANDASADRTEMADGDGQESYISCAAEHTGQTQCAQLRNENGAIVGRRLVNRSGAMVTNEVTLRRNGGIVYAAAANTLDDKWGVGSPASAETPPLTLDQLEDLVRNDTWVRPAT